jgi:hypothetical protein
MVIEFQKQKKEQEIETRDPSRMRKPQRRERAQSRPDGPSKSCLCQDLYLKHSNQTVVSFVKSSK